MSAQDVGFALYHLPGQSKKQPKKQPDKAADLAKLGEAQKEKKHGILYICGNCGQQVELKPSDHVRCRHCGHRILYKKRTQNGMMYEAR